MTTIQIANSVNKDDRTVRRWVKKLSDKMPVMADKMSASTSTYPADFTLDETIAIIECGLGKNAADMFAANAAIKKVDEEGSSIGAAILTLTLEIKRMNDNNNAIERRISALETSKLLPAPVNDEPIVEYFTVIGHARNIGMTLANNAAMSLGKQCAELSRVRGIEIQSVPNSHYGRINTYRVDILRDIIGW